VNRAKNSARLYSKLILNTLICGATIAWLPFAPQANAVERAIPALSAPVIDEAGILPSSARAELEAELKSYLPKIQLEVWIINSLQDEPIENLSIRAADQWKLGDSKTDRGAILLIAVQDHKMRIEVGRGLEGDIPDAYAFRIVDQILKPAFRAQNYEGGILNASRTLYRLAGGNLTPDQAQDLPQMTAQQSRGSIPIFLWIKIILVIVFILIRLLSYSMGMGRRRSVWWGGGGGGLSGGGWSSGGGGWSGGGGGFSGGGSSGSW